jgi:hypothetical protein
MNSELKASGINIIEEKKFLNPLLSFLFICLCVSVMYITLDKGFELYALGAVLGLGFVYLFIKYPKIWIYTIMLSSFVFFHGSSEGINAFDVATALIYNAFLYCWLFWEIFINKEKIIRGVQDWFIIAFFLILMINMLIAFFIGTPLIEWISEFVLYSTILLYFPIRKYFTEKKDIQLLLIAFAISAVMASFYHLYIYKEGIIEKSIYIFQLGGSLRVNQALYTICSAVGLIFLLNAKKFYSRSLLFLFVGLNFISLLTTFSRTFWLLLLIMIVVIFIYMASKRLTIILYGVILSTIFITSVFIVFPNNADMVF